MMGAQDDTYTLTSRQDALARDAADPLAHYREAFVLPKDVIYLDGNSLGPLTHQAARRIEVAVHEEWGRGLIRSWNEAGWVDLPRTVAADIAALIGAGADDVRVCDSTSVNLYKVLSVALKCAARGHVIISEPGNFPTDLYIAESVARLNGARLLLAEDPYAALAEVGEDTAVLMLTEVDYRSGARQDMAALTKAAHAVGALTVWDLAHSAGAFPVDLAGADADFAIGCGYKYLNGGPGAPAFVYAAPRHQGHAQPLSGWFGHAAPFAFEPAFRAADGMDRYLTGTAPILSLVGLGAAMEVWRDVELSALREKSIELCALFIAEVERRAGGSLRLATPRTPHRRGSQVSFHCADGGFAVMQALIARGVIGDFRAPDILRFGFAPLYNRYVDAWDAAEALSDILATRAWDDPRHHVRAAVT